LFPEIVLTKLGTVPHINAKPIIYPLENELVKHRFDISYYNPALLSGKLYNGEVDIGLIPVAEFLRVGNYRVFPDISISSYGSVDSVALLVKGRLKDISAVAVDSCSRSSTALLRIVLEIFCGIAPEYVRRDYGPGFYDEVDASMVFGDIGLKVLYDRPEGYTIWVEELGSADPSFTAADGSRDLLFLWIGIRENRSPFVAIVFVGGCTEQPASPAIYQVVHVVRLGDTLHRIAQPYGVSVADLATFNCLTEAETNNLKIGQQIYIPPEECNGTVTDCNWKNNLGE
jgi:hypothetical protein